MTNKKCKDCGYEQEIRTDVRRRQNSKWRCTDCGSVHKLILATIAVVFVLSMGTAYAEQQVLVELPIDRPFKVLPEEDPDRCYGWDSFGTFNWQCFWQWDTTTETNLPDNPQAFNGTAYKIWLDEVIPIVEANPFQEPETEESIDVEDLIDEPSPTPFEQLDPEVRKALGQLKICQLGLDEWIAIVPEYNLTTSDEAPIFKHLGKDRQLMQLALNYQECRGNTEYPWLSQQYNDTYRADQEGIKQALARLESDDRRLMAEGKTASDEDKIQAIADARDYMCKPANLHLKLCSAYVELTGINRGNPEPAIGGDYDNVNIFAEGGDPQTGQGIIEEYRSAQAANIQTEQDLKNYYNRVQQAVCDEYTERYEYKIRTYIEDGKTITDYSNYPQWLMHCID